MTSHLLFPHTARLLACAGLTLALAGCGMKGDLRLPDPPPPADAALAAPPTVTPAPAPDSRPVSQP
ncbi:MAG: lipoprotein [Castellaniella sp.]|uniref:Lipoprotein n=1 Tax=Castellaniella hirudinis TaxID=1144617 RepID=A0ABV8RZS7_9BURK